MSSRLKLLCAIGGAALAGLLLGRLQGLPSGFTAFTALLAGMALGRFLFGANEASGANTPQYAAPALSSGRDSRRAAGGPDPSNALLEATMNRMREGVLVVDSEMRVVASNSAARAVFSRDARPLEGSRLSDLTRNPTVYSAFRVALERGESTEVKVELSGDERRFFDLLVVPSYLDNLLTVRGATAVLFDITRLERLERVRQEFLSNVSHELRTPLTSILAFVETLENGALNEPENSRRFLAVISKNATRMHDLINDILELSSIEAGTARVEKAGAQLYPIVEDIKSALAAKAASRSVTVRNEVCADVLVFADKRRLEQMLTNLIDNAIKFNREGGSVTIRHQRDERDQISVIDTGDGIPVEQTERIFERFYRLDRARSREMGGTGLGLAIVKHLARAHGGEVTVHSKVDEGSTFIIELPCPEISTDIQPTDTGT